MQSVTGGMSRTLSVEDGEMFRRIRLHSKDRRLLISLAYVLNFKIGSQFSRQSFFLLYRHRFERNTQPQKDYKIAMKQQQSMTLLIREPMEVNRSERGVNIR